jgi:hypothetical protein
MMYVTVLLYPREQLADELGRTLLERRFGKHLVEAGGVRATQAGRVRMVREAYDRDVRIRVRDLLRVDASDVADDELGLLDAIRADEAVIWQHDFELAAEEEIDPSQQDRRLARGGPAGAGFLSRARPRHGGVVSVASRPSDRVR